MKTEAEVKEAIDLIDKTCSHGPSLAGALSIALRWVIEHDTEDFDNLLVNLRKSSQETT